MPLCKYIGADITRIDGAPVRYGEVVFVETVPNSLFIPIKEEEPVHAQEPPVSRRKALITKEDSDG